MKHSIPQRLLSALLLLALAVSLFATAALAEPVAVAAADVVVKTGRDGSITVTVYDTDPGTPGTGAQWTPDTSVQGVEGVGINALRIGDVVELTTTVGGKVQTQVAFGFTLEVCTLLGLSTNNAIASLTDDATTTYYFAPSAATAALGTKNQATIEEHLDTNATLNYITGANGIASFTGLTYGVYLLAKSALPADATTDLSPFLVSVPMYVEADGTWNKDVYAYPKVRTGTLAITKTATVGDNDDPAIYVNAGETIQYTISVPIPATGSGAGGTQNFAAFTVTDTNEGNTLNITGGIAGVTVSLVNDTTTKELDPADYTVTYPGNGPNSVLTVTLTDAGLQKLNAGLDQAQTFTITYSATAATDVDFSTGLTNSAALSYDRGSGSLTNSASVTLYTYGIDLTKTLSDRDTTITPGAITFALYTDADCTAKIPMTPGTGPNDGYWRAASENEPATVMSVGTDGKLKIYGLAPGTYYLKELTTMNHYTRLAAPIVIVITGAATPEAPGAITATVNGEPVTPQGGLVPLAVENTRNTNGFNLPQTGGAGTLAAIAIGLGLLSCAVILLVIYRKKENR